MLCSNSHSFTHVRNLHNGVFYVLSLTESTLSNAQEGESTGNLWWRTGANKFWFDSCPWAWVCVPMPTCCYYSSTSWQDEITCWCLTRCLTSHRSHTYRTPGLKTVAGASPASSCPDLTVAFPRTWCWCPPISAWLKGHQALMCSASSSVLECSSCLAPCHWCLCLCGNKWQQNQYKFTDFK